MSVKTVLNTGLHTQALLPKPELKTPDSVSTADRAKLKELSEEFESVFLDLVLKSMRDTIPKSELLDGGNGEEIFRGMLDSEYAKAISQQKMTGIAATIEKDLLKVMEIQSSANQKLEGLRSYGNQDLPKPGFRGKIDED